MTITTQQIDLWRQSPSEDQRLEFKEAKKQFDNQKLYEYCVAIANEGGGYLLLGIADKPPRPVVGTQAFQNPIKTEERIFEKLRFRVRVEEVSHPEGRVIVLHIPSRPRGTAYNLDGKYLMRVGAMLVPMTEDRLRTIFAEIGPNWNQHSYTSDLVIANLLGAWNEKNNADFEVVRQLAYNRDLDSWISEIRGSLQHPLSPIALKNGQWHIKERKSLWQTLGPRVFDSHLDILKQCTVSVLSELDPQFELPPQERYAAVIHGKVLKHSYELRKGLAESLALLGTQPSALSNCSQHKPEITAFLAVREIFENADWKLWGSLNNLLPILAEASSDEFLRAVEEALLQTPCPFDELFAQESSGIMGGTYITGLLWALETLAWDENFLVRACGILGELADRDPGGSWGNRPANSLRTILLPWLPQTTASTEKRKVALQTLRKQVPTVAWRLLLALLPDQTQASSPTPKPSWRNTIPDDWKEGVSNKEYWEQVSFCANLTVEMASDDLKKLENLIGQLHSLPEPAFDQVLEHLSSEAVSNGPEDQYIGLWTQLTMFVRKHRRFSDAKWALSAETVSRIETAAYKLAPQNPLNLHRMMFTRFVLDLYEENENIEEQERKLGERRQQAVKDILSYGGMDAILQFVEDVESPSDVGHSLGAVAEATVDEQILPALLETSDQKLAEFTKGYVWSRRYSNGWEWVDGLDRLSWSTSQIGRFLSYLPFTEEAWNRATDWLGGDEGEYWGNAWLSPYVTDGDMGFSIGKLIEYGRPRAAIRCLEGMLHGKQPLDNALSIKSLIAALSSSEPFDSMGTYYINEIIKALQDDPETNPDDLFMVEWAYLPLLDGREGTLPKTLESRLATDPDFFCEVVRLLYRSQREDRPKRESSERDKAIAENAWRLLDEWRISPGTQTDGTFSPDQFDRWLSQVRKTCNESGHLDVAFTHIGQVLIHCPPDPEGLWMYHSVADALNDRSLEQMRRGYNVGIINARGAHFIDPSGRPERELADQYRKKAEDIENAGYQRFATELRRLAGDFDRQADEIVARQGREEHSV